MNNKTEETIIGIPIAEFKRKLERVSLGEASKENRRAKSLEELCQRGKQKTTGPNLE